MCMHYKTDHIKLPTTAKTGMGHEEEFLMEKKIPFLTTWEKDLLFLFVCFEGLRWISISSDRNSVMIPTLHSKRSKTTLTS